MKKIYVVTLIAATALVLASCGKSSSVENAIAQIEQSLDKYESNAAPLDRASWEAFMMELNAPKAVIDAADEKGKLTEDEKLRIQKVGERIAALLGGQAAGNIPQVEDMAADSTETEVSVD